MDGAHVQSPAAPVIAVVVLFILTLLFAQDWHRSESGSISDVVQTTTATSPAPTATEPSTVEATVAPTVSTTAVPTVSTTVANIDQLTADDVSAALEVAGFPKIEVEIDGGTVTLRGVVPDPASKRAVLNQVGVVPGVDQIRDEITTG